ncbi:permease prefix domain 1-containing protein [Deinococcus gobiensis]|uniref:Uncharacterized protein n=1 Tax=Deinococcus gobiensis (strain DSM 21396 / JCM 16679 / CGMCC 1.7299 / I-0) TaxID=745776 RepID=H8H3P3_DEIGI|nr:permease prefix domain 1-containing protein [Deinococcus gobiensis]AFD28140.1 hypothetical protein DGo_PD0066 [Deinococcus gobiensis I-0]
MTGHLWGLRSQAALQLYLRRATWGLPLARRQTVWDELEEHVLERAAHLEVQGTLPAEALDRALRELGPPLRISAGMNGVYNMPKLVMLGTAATLAVSGALYALAGGAGGKTVTLLVLEDGPAKPCTQGAEAPLPLPVVSKDKFSTCYQDDSRRRRGAFLSFGTVQAAWQAIGGEANIQPDGRLKLTFPEGGYTVMPREFNIGGEGYVMAARLLAELSNTWGKAQLIVSGFDRPVLHLGETVIRLGDGTVSIGDAFYSEVAGQVIGALAYRPDVPYSAEMLYASATDATQTVHTGLPAGEVVVALQREGKDRFRIAYGPVGADGVVRFKLGRGQVRFVASAAELEPVQSGQSTPTLLVRVSNVPLNKLQGGVLSPAQLRLLRSR